MLPGSSSTFRLICDLFSSNTAREVYSVSASYLSEIKCFVVQLVRFVHFVDYLLFHYDYSVDQICVLICQLRYLLF